MMLIQMNVECTMTTHLLPQMRAVNVVDSKSGQLIDGSHRTNEKMRTKERMIVCSNVINQMTIINLET